jgi:hypothetical protein
MKKLLVYIILIMALGLAGTVAYVSVTGLLKVFAGAGMAGLIFFIGIEVGKIVATSAIHTYGKIIGWFYNLILSLFILIAMGITSLGIYGFLSSSYKESFAKMENMDTQIELLEKRRDGYQTQLDIVNTEKESVTQTITELSKGLSNNKVQYKDPETGELITTTSSSTRRALEKQLNRATERQEVLNAKSDELSDKVFEIEGEITEVKLSDGTSNELGPLKYLADVTGMSMDDVMKYFIFLLIIIGDPMAVLMVIVFNKIVNKDKEEKVKVEKKESKISKLFKSFKKKTTDQATVKDNDNTISGNYTAILGGPPRNTATGAIIDPKTGQILNMKYEPLEIEKHYPPYENEVVDDAENDAVEPEPEVIEEVADEVIEPTPEPEVEEVVESESEVTPEEPRTVQLEDIKEIKEKNRGFSVKIPNRKKSNNTIGKINYFKK